jgi:hypothetical protein
MTRTTYIGDNKFDIHLKEKGCGVAIYKNGRFYHMGQYYPEDERLALKDCNQEDVIKILEKEIAGSINLEDVEFPYVEGY